MVKVLEILYKISKQFVKYELRLFLLNGQIHTCEEALPYRHQLSKGYFKTKTAEWGPSENTTSKAYLRIIQTYKTWDFSN